MLVVFYCLLHPGAFNVETVVGVVLYDVLDFVLSHSGTVVHTQICTLINHEASTQCRTTIM